MKGEIQKLKDKLRAHGVEVKEDEPEVDTAKEERSQNPRGATPLVEGSTGCCSAQTASTISTPMISSSPFSRVSVLTMLAYPVWQY